MHATRALLLCFVFSCCWLLLWLSLSTCYRDTISILFVMEHIQSNPMRLVVGCLSHVFLVIFVVVVVAATAEEDYKGTRGGASSTRSRFSGGGSGDVVVADNLLVAEEDQVFLAPEDDWSSSDLIVPWLETHKEGRYLQGGKCQQKSLKSCNLWQAHILGNKLLQTATKAKDCSDAVTKFQDQAKIVKGILEDVKVLPSKLKPFREELVLLRKYLKKVQPAVSKIKVVGGIFAGLYAGFKKMIRLVDRISDYEDDLNKRIKELNAIIKNLNSPSKVASMVSNAVDVTANGFLTAIGSSVSCSCIWSKKIDAIGSEKLDKLRKANALFDVCTTTFTPLDQIVDGLERVGSRVAAALPAAMLEDLLAFASGAREYAELLVDKVGRLENDLVCCNAASVMLRESVLSIVNVFNVATCYTKGIFKSSTGSIELLDKMRDVVDLVNNFSSKYNKLVGILVKSQIGLGDYRKLVKNKIKRKPEFEFSRKDGPVFKQKASWDWVPNTEDIQVVELAQIELSVGGVSFNGIVTDIVSGCLDEVDTLLERPPSCCTEALDCSSSDSMILWDQPYCRSSGSRSGTLPVLHGSGPLTHMVKAKSVSCIRDNSARSMRIFGPAPAGMTIQVFENADDPCENDFATIELKKSIRTDDLVCIDIFTENFSDADYSIRYTNKNGKLRRASGAASMFLVMKDDSMIGLEGCCPGGVEPCISEAGKFCPAVGECCPCAEGEACKLITDGRPELGRSCQVCSFGKKVDEFGRECVDACPPGYELLFVGSDECFDIDECSSSSSGSLCSGDNEECANAEGGFLCSCKVGFERVTGICDNIDECARFGNLLCSGNQDCVDSYGSYGCKCKDGFFRCADGSCFSSCCGDGLCQTESPYDEDEANCFRDCGSFPGCPNGSCEPSFNEDQFSCPQDCGNPCGNGSCDTPYGETEENCRADCATDIFCGDGFCDTFAGEDASNCRVDCYKDPILCGDGKCDDDLGEICPRDCGPPECGDGYCDTLRGEDCFADCAPGAPNCPGGRDCSTMCVALGACCLYEKQCADGSCSRDRCCAEDRFCEPPSFARPPIVRGDPHISTYFGIQYECQGVGIFSLLNSLDSKLQLQALFAAVPGDVSASVTTGLAMADEGYPTLQVSIARGLSLASIPLSQSGCNVHIFLDGILQSQLTEQELIAGVSFDGGLMALQYNAETQFFRLDYFVHMLNLQFEISKSDAFGCFIPSERVDYPIQYGSFGQRAGYRSDETIVGLLGSPYGAFNFYDADGTLFQPDALDAATMYDFCTTQYCTRLSEASLFQYEPEFPFEDVSNCDAEYVGVDVLEAPPEVVEVCGTDTSCLVDGTVAARLGGQQAGLDASLQYIASLLRVDESIPSSLFRFSHGVIPAFQTTDVSVTIELNQNVQDLEGFALYRVFAETFSQEGQLSSVLLDNGSGIGEDDIADDSIYSASIPLTPVSVGEIFGFRAVPIIAGAEDPESTLAETAWTALRAFREEEIPNPSSPPSSSSIPSNSPTPPPTPTSTPSPAESNPPTVSSAPQSNPPSASYPPTMSSAPQSNPPSSVSNSPTVTSGPPQSNPPSVSDPPTVSIGPQSNPPTVSFV